MCVNKLIIIIKYKIYIIINPCTFVSVGVVCVIGWDKYCILSVEDDFNGLTHDSIVNKKIAFSLDKLYFSNLNKLHNLLVFDE